MAMHVAVTSEAPAPPDSSTSPARRQVQDDVGLIVVRCRVHASTVPGRALVSAVGLVTFRKTHACVSLELRNDPSSTFLELISRAENVRRVLRLGGLVLPFVLWGGFASESLGAASEAARVLVVDRFGWSCMLTAAALLQTASIVAAFPFAVVLLLTLVSPVTGLRDEETQPRPALHDEHEPERIQETT